MSEAENRSLTPALTLEERRQIIELLHETVQGKRPDTGRDELAGAARLEIGGMHGRALACTASTCDAGPGAAPGAWAYRLAAGAGEIVVRMVQTGEYVHTYGDLAIDAPDRIRGAAFADAMAGWLGTPLEPSRTAAASGAGGARGADRTGSSEVAAEAGGVIDLGAPAVPLRGGWVKLGVHYDADGVRWDVYKLLVEAGTRVEVFLRVSPGAGRAALAEKRARNREPLLVGFDRHLGAGRAIAERTRIDVFGGAWLTVPPDWIATRLAAHVRVTDPEGEAVLEISYQPFPLHPRLPGLAERLALAVDGLAAAPGAVVAVDRGDFEYVWTEHDHEAIDPGTGERRAGCGRVLIAANDALQTLVTFNYWPIDAGWAVPAWETIISTLRLAGRTPETQELTADASVGVALAG